MSATTNDIRYGSAELSEQLEHGKTLQLNKLLGNGRASFVCRSTEKVSRPVGDPTLEHTSVWRILALNTSSGSAVIVGIFLAPHFYLKMES
jgi:hypothetical protein